MSDLRATHIFEIRINAEGDKLCLANPSNDDSGAYRIAGPKAWGGSSLIEDIEIRESNLITYIREYAPHLAPLIASDLIEQQQQRIAELEATVERLREQLSAMATQHQCGCNHPACNRCRDDADNRKALQSTPQQSLAEHDADVARKAILAAAEDYRKEYIGQGVERLLTEFADVYAKRIRDGE